MPNAELICAHHKSMLGRKAAWTQHWQDVLDYVLPTRTPVVGFRQKGARQGALQYDATATRFMRRLSSTLMGLMVSPAERWFGLRPLGAEGVEEVEAWLDMTAEMLYDEFHRSNFYVEIPETLVDLVTIGTGGLFMDEKRIERPGFNGFWFRNMAPGEFSIEENDENRVDIVMRDIKWTARQAKLRFPEVTLSEKIEEALKSEDQALQDKEFDFIHAVYPRTDPLLGEGNSRAADRSRSGMDWLSVYIDAEEKKIVDEGGYRDRRYFTPRWSRSSGEMYGRSPAMEALPDIKTLNTLTKYGLEGLALHVYPAWLFPNESIVGRLRLTPGARNVYNPSVNGKIEALTSKGDFRVEAAKEEQLRSAIAAAFLDDIFGLRDSGDRVTATEVLDRRERRQQITGPAATRLMNELLGPVVESGWMMMFRAGAFGQPPAALLAAERLEVEYLSPLARAQKMGTARAFQDAFAILQPLLQSVPGLLDNYDLDAISRDIPDNIGVPRKWLTGEDRRDAIRQQRVQQQQQAVAAEQGMAMAETAAKVSEAG